MSEKKNGKNLVERSGLTVGLNRGYKTHKRVVKPRPVSRKGVMSKSKMLARSVIRSVVGSAPYEKRIYELLRINKDKQARKFAKKRLGTLRRAKKKCEEISQLIAEMKRTGNVTFH